MPARITDTSWDFGPALALINQTHYVDTGGGRDPKNTEPQELDTAKKEAKSGLGDFSELWTFLGQPHDLPPPDVSSTSSREALSQLAKPATPDSTIGFSASSEEATGDSQSREGNESRCQARQDLLVPLVSLDSSFGHSDVTTNLAAGEFGLQRMPVNDSDIAQNEGQQLAGKEAVTEGESSPPLETPSEWEAAAQARFLARKEKKRLKKEKRKADRERMAGANSLSDIEMVMPTPAKINGMPAILPKTPKTPKRPGSPYKAASSYKIFTRERISKSPVKDATKLQGERDVVKMLGNVPQKAIHVKQDTVSLLTPDYETTRSQLHTPSAPGPRAVPQSAPSKPNFTLYPSVVQAPLNHVKSQALTCSHAALLSFREDARPQGYESLQPLARNNPPTVAQANQALAEAYGFKVGVNRQLFLLSKLMSQFPNDIKWLASPMQMSTNKTTNNGIHVFVDASNIIIGFYDELRRQLGNNLPNSQLHEFHISFDSLVLLMERRRPVAKRILVGSKPELPAFETARQVGYKVDILDKVHKVKELTDRQKFFQQQDLARMAGRSARRRSTGYGTGDQSGSETTAGQFVPQEKKWVEQGVDEILHLNMLESLIDAEQPSTIVLATGDAAEAEYSAGFKKMVERALGKGWNVELISWSRQISQAYRKHGFTSTWAGQFTVIELDLFVRDLLDV